MSINEKTQEMIDNIENEEKIYIYGAGRNATLIYRFILLEGGDISGFIVSDIKENPSQVMGKPVVEINDFNENDGVVLVSFPIKTSLYKQIIQLLIDYNIRKIYSIDQLMLDEMKKKLAITIIDDGHFIVGGNKPVEDFHVVFGEQLANNKLFWWRISYTLTNLYCQKYLSELFCEKSAGDEFIDLYGTYVDYDKLELLPNNEKYNYCIYMATSHLDRISMDIEHTVSWEKTIQVGAALTSKNRCLIKDNQGENISKRNTDYSECTAIYWMWKNAPKTDYIGLCHYRRHFAIGEDRINAMGDNKVDIVMTRPTFIPGNIYSFIANLAAKRDLDLMLEAIHETYPSYYENAQKLMKGRFFSPCNLFIMRWDIFKEYAEFMFAITFKIESFYKGYGIIREDRYMGYIAECLLNIFVINNKNKYKFAYSDMIFYSKNTLDD